MDLIIRDKIIEAPIRDILFTLRKELNNGLLKDIGIENNNNVSITCIAHKGGRETHPSCSVFCKRDDKKVEYGTVHCFTCGYTSGLPQFVADCFNQTIEYGEEWLIDRFGSLLSSGDEYLPPIEIDNLPKKEFLSPEILNQYMYYHPYMWQRGLSKEVVDRFAIGFDKEREAITFPVWDESGNLVMITSRSVNSKYFHIEKNKDKPVYLLNYIIKHNIDTVYVCESQVNTLTLWSWGYPAIGLIGTGSTNQYEILNKCGIRNYILCLDGDEAGDKGIKRFIKNIRKDVFVSVKCIPRGKDVNDLTKEQFDCLEEKYI